jgi:hypothetical protein
MAGGGGGGGGGDGMRTNSGSELQVGLESAR